MSDTLDLAMQPPSKPARETRGAPVAGACAPTRVPQSVDFDRDVHCIFGLPFDATSLERAAEQVRTAALAGRPMFLSTPNVNWVVTARDNPAFRASVVHSDLSIADGAPIVWAARLLGLPIRERVAGSDLFDRLRTSSGTPLNAYFFGGMESAAPTASAQLNAEGRGLRGAGGESPGVASVAELSHDDYIARINASGAHMLIVALGAQKGQAWIERNRPALTPGVVTHLGAVVNFASGRLRRAPAWARRIGFEWIWRCLTEPGLWRRYWNDGLVFSSLLVRRLLPLVWMLRIAPAGSAPAPGRVALLESTAQPVLNIAGGWRAEDSSVLRAALRHAASLPTAPRLVFERGTRIDLGIVALLLLMEGACEQRGLATPTIVSHDRWIFRLLTLCGLHPTAATDSPP